MERQRRTRVSAPSCLTLSHFFLLFYFFRFILLQPGLDFTDSFYAKATGIVGHNRGWGTVCRSPDSSRDDGNYHVLSQKFLKITEEVRRKVGEINPDEIDFFAVVQFPPPK